MASGHPSPHPAPPRPAIAIQGRRGPGPPLCRPAQPRPGASSPLREPPKTWRGNPCPRVTSSPASGLTVPGLCPAPAASFLVASPVPLSCWGSGALGAEPPWAPCSRDASCWAGPGSVPSAEGRDSLWGLPRHPARPRLWASHGRDPTTRPRACRARRMKQSLALPAECLACLEPARPPVPVRAPRAQTGR